MNVILKAVPSAYSFPNSHQFTTRGDGFGFEVAYKDEIYTGATNLQNVCACIESNSRYVDSTMLYHGFDLSSIPKAIVNSAIFKIQIEAFNENVEWQSDRVTEAYFELLGANDKSLFKASILDGDYCLIKHPSRKTFTIDLTNVATVEDLKDFKIKFFVKNKQSYNTSRLKFVGASLTVDYSPVTETVMVPNSFSYPFKCKKYVGPLEGEPGHLIEENVSTGGIYTHNLFYCDAQYYDFNYNILSRFCPIRKAFIRFKAQYSGGLGEATFAVYSGESRLAIFKPEFVDYEEAIYTVDLPDIAYAWLKDLKFVIEAKAKDSYTTFLMTKGIELHILHEDPVYRGHIATGYASNYYNPPMDGSEEWIGFRGIERPECMFTEPTASTNYSSYYTRLNYVGAYNGSVYLFDFNFTAFEGVEWENIVIDRIDLRVKEFYTYSKVSPIYYVLYLGDNIIGQAQYTPSGDRNVYYTRHIMYEGLNLKYEDLVNLKLRITSSNTSNGQNCSTYISGPGVDLWTGAGIPEPELPTIVETNVQGDYTKNPEAFIPSTNVKPIEEPKEPGYIGNLYNDDLDDYAEFNYTPSPEQPAPEPDPEEPDRLYESIVIDSPTFETLGIPKEANITRVVLTEEGYIYSSDSKAEADFGLYINNKPAHKRPFSNSSSFDVNIFDTGEISLPRLEIERDVATFQIRWYSLDSDFTYRVKYLLWDITFEMGGLSYVLRFNQKNLDKIIVGNREVMSLYVGDFQIL